MSQDLFAGPWKPALDRLGAALRALHKSLIDSTRRDYERAHGRIGTPVALFALVAQDPAFAWLRPLTRLIVEVEDLLDRKAPALRKEDVLEAARKARALLAEGDFAKDYRTRLETDSALAAEHGRFRSVLDGTPSTHP